MQETEADHTAGQGRPSLLNHREPVVADPHPSQALQPTDRSLHDPSHFSQAATMRRSPPCDMRINAEPGQYPARVGSLWKPRSVYASSGNSLGRPGLPVILGKSAISGRI